MKLMTRYMGLLYPDEDSPRWPRSSGREVRRLVDSVLRRDPRMVGLLYLRAHTLMLDGFPTLARRDLALAGALIPADQVGTNKPAAGAWHTLYTI